MDDLAGIDWSKNTSNQKPPAANYTLNNTSFSSLRPTPPVSGRATPLSGNAPSIKPLSKPATPAQSGDNFANLVSWSSNPSNTKLSLQEQQKKLAEARLQSGHPKQTLGSNHWAGADDAVWNSLGSGRSTPAPSAQQNGSTAPRSGGNDEDDLFADFNAHKAQTAKSPECRPAPAAAKASQDFPDDDDPFGLAGLQQKTVSRQETTSTMHSDDDDVLGLLGKPVDLSRRRPDQEEPQRPKPKGTSSEHPQDKAIAELVDMGFPAEKAKAALETTDSGFDVQAAVGYLLNSAHEEARERSQSRNQAANGQSNNASSTGRGGLMQRRQQQIEKDPSQVAADIGASFFKTANSLWKQGQKKVQQAVQEFNSDSESGSQPKWMREAGQQEGSGGQKDNALPTRRRPTSSSGKRKEADVTDEA
ncbi:uncharacterized protein AB675_3103 [Cyphellophora attinorum]|uniref:UBA domain-containing protein n=1 Tax=Cyphellophora attinorum TaxID=1664694 RepID=A0A0N1H6I6_9EURO|nr:uncharacterized protein AB675_3103 [Phialophora attinorum]KPI37847.1 hypothetical protein AB675_3103 [Phialophora attinorum]